MPDVQPNGLAFQEAIDFFRAKVSLPTKTWTDLWQGQHARAFVVAGAIQADLVADLRQAVDAAIAQGETIEQFRKRFDEIVAKSGWSYNGSRGWRTGVIFNTNLRTAYQAGRWAQIQQLKATRPYLRYTAVMDLRTRPLHRLWHNTVLPVDDPWWDTHYPPNGWNCRCTVQSLNARDLDRYGLKISDQAPPVDLVKRLINVDGAKVEFDVPKGIDPGFGYNVGKAGYGAGQEAVAGAADSTKPTFTALKGPREALPPPPLPDAVPPIAPDKLLPPATTEKELRQRLTDALGGPETIFMDPTGARVLINQTLIDHYMEHDNPFDGRDRFFPFIPELIENPQEIWVGFATNDETGKVELRRRYLRIIELNKDRRLILVTDIEAGLWRTVTFNMESRGQMTTVRTGLLIYKGDEMATG
jgi:SPP1 gp7 family putative phage head morphogenesis protein